LRNFGLRLHRPLHQIRPALADRTALAVKTRPNSRPLIEWLGYFRYWQIVLKKSSFAGRAKILRTADAVRAWRREGPHHFA